MNRVCHCGLNLDIWQNPWNHQSGCSMRSDTPAADHPTDVSEFRDQLAEELDGHNATITGAHERTTWLDCSCGWETVITSPTGRLAGARERWRTHRADALLPLIDARVQAAAKKRAAEELRDAYWATAAITHAEAVRDVVRTRAAALAQPDGRAEG